MNPPLPSRPPAAQLLLRLIQVLLGSGLIVALNLLAGLALLAVVPAAKPAAYRLLGLSAFGDVALWPSLAFVAAVSAVLIGLAWRFRAHAWWCLGGGWLAVTPVLTYLAIDDTVVRRPMSIEEVAPSFPGAETSHRLLQRYARGRPEAETFQDPGRDLVWPRQGATPADYTAFLQANRAALDAGWTQLAPVRAWYAELAAFDRIGDAEFAGSMPKLEWGEFFARSTGWRRLLNPLAYFFYNRNRMLNEVGALSAEVQELAARRRPEQADDAVAAYFRGPGRPGFKNFIGRHLAADSFHVPKATLISTYWDTEDLQAALTQKLASR